MEFNVEPYYDDFKQNALDNNYLRILFKPGYAVQARELTQIQSILQNQIKQFGNHIFQNGSPVIGGNLSLDNKVKYLKLETTYNNQDVDTDNFVDAIVRNSSGTVQAKVLTTYYPTGGTPTLLVKYITGNEFDNADVITIATTTTQAQLVAANSSGLASVCSINEGVFYVDGFFIKVLDQTTVLNPYGTSANVKVGLQISEDIVDSLVDTTLLDPAQGSFNYQAPGADRYQFNLVLSTRPLDSVVDESKFFELMRVENGVITKQVKYPVYAELEKSLARRTYEQSGDFTVRPFRATIVDGTDANNYTIAVEPGKAYVKGFEFETLGTLKIDVPKPRSASDVRSYVDVDVDTSSGNYVYVTSIRGSSNGFINIAAFEKVDIHCVDISKVNASGLVVAANTAVYANTRIGTARIKSFSREAADLFGSDRANTDSNGIYKIYLTDVSIQPKIVKVSGNTGLSSTINLSDKFSSTADAYANVSLTILPIRLDAVPNVASANVLAYSQYVNANSAVASVFSGGNVSIGDVIRVGDMVRQVSTINTAGDYLTVNSAWSQTIIGTQVFKQTAYEQQVSSQIRTIAHSAYSSGNTVLTLDKGFDDNGIADANTVIQLNFGLADADSFVAGPAVVANANIAYNTITPNVNVAMNVSSIGRLSTGATYAEDPLNTKLIYELPGNYVKRNSLKNVDIFHNKFVSNRTRSATNGQFTLSTSSGLLPYESVEFAATTKAIQDNLVVVVRDNSGNTYFPNGSVLQLTSANVIISGIGDSIIINTNISDLMAVDIMVNVKQNDANSYIRKKNFKSNTTYTTSPFTYPTTNATANVSVTLPNVGEVANIDVANGLIWLSNANFNAVQQGGTISLFAPDVIKVRKVLAGTPSALPNSVNFTDVTERFGLLSGASDDLYDHSALQLLPGFDSVNATLLVHVDLYQHVYTSGSVSYFSSESYDASIYNSGQIPIYKSTLTGKTYYLRDCLDFRPTRAIGDISSSYQVPYIPGTDTRTELSFDYYLPRIDKLVLSKDKEFRVIQGTSAARPIPPNDIDDAMTLFQINLPPFVANVLDVNLKYFENRRYTMKDIASLDKRVQQIAYHVSLNNAENQAMSDPTLYEDGTDKTKYGIVGENFSNFNIGDYKHPDFYVALENGMMLPAIQYLVSGLKQASSNAIAQNMKTISLNYTETPAITQSVCSNKAVSVQPFLFGAFNGTVELYPDTDYWVSQQLKPEVIAPPQTIVTQTNITNVTNIVTEKQVIKEVVIEVDPPITVPTPTTNANNVIKTTNNPPPPPANDEVVVVTTPAANNPPVIPDVICVYPPPPPPPPPQTDQCTDVMWYYPQDLMYGYDATYMAGYYGGFYGVLPLAMCTNYATITPDPYIPPPEPPPPPLPPPPVDPVVTQPIYAGGGGGGGCPDPSMLILLADGTWIAAGDLQVGMVVKTQHEHTFAWGEFNVTAKAIVTQPKLEISFSDKKVIVSKSHRFWVESRNAWINSEHLEKGDVINGFIVTDTNDLGDGPVVKITIDEAHTYIMEDLLSHNMKMLGDEVGDFAWGSGSGGWGSYDAINRF